MRWLADAQAFKWLERRNCKEMKKIGIIGTGAIAGIHAAAIKAIKNVELVAVCSSSPARAQEAETRLGVLGYSDISAFLAHPELDVVCVCTASGRHLEPALAAAKAGKHLMIEKPIEVTLDRADQLIQACQSAGVKLAVIFQNRFSSDYQKLKFASDAGLFGRILMGNAYVNWFRNDEYYTKSDWKGTIAIDGGGAFINQGIHTIDLLLDLMGEVSEVFGKVQTAYHEIEGEVEPLEISPRQRHFTRGYQSESNCLEQREVQSLKEAKSRIGKSKEKNLSWRKVKFLVPLEPQIPWRSVVFCTRSNGKNSF